MPQKPVAPDVHLTAKEFAEGRSAVRRFIAAHPVGERPSWGMPRFVWSPVVASVLLVTLATGAAAAEGSMPGDPLYAIKVHVTEPLVSLGYFGEDARSLRTLALLERRSEEIDVLDANDDTSNEAWEAAEDAVLKTSERLNALPQPAAQAIRRHLRERSEEKPVMAKRNRLPAAERATALLESLMEDTAVAVETSFASETANREEVDMQAYRIDTDEAASDTTQLLRAVPAIPEFAPAVAPLLQDKEAGSDIDDKPSDPPRNRKQETRIIDPEPTLMMKTLIAPDMPGGTACEPEEERAVESFVESSAASSCESSASGSVMSSSSAAPVIDLPLRVPSPVPEADLPVERPIPTP